MVLHFLRQDFDQRFRGNVLGTTWALLAPLLQLALFAFVFSYIFKARVPGLAGLGYVAFLSLGMWPWFAFSEAISRGSTALTEQAGLLQKVAIEPWVLVASRVAGAFLLHGTAFLVVVLVLRVLGAPLDLALLPLTVPFWLGLLMLAGALALAAASCTVFLRDLQQVIQYVLPAWMFLTPIMYAQDMVPTALRGWLSWNPLTGLISAIRAPVLEGSLSHAWVPGPTWLVVAVAFLMATLLYRRLRPHLIDFL